ncbi:MAG: AmmeMemoRadiSam system radical SAM enzyme [Oscillospiraceae bacterium]|nr:AmmeMemoRadiSam system radical SAM enzyme [Oscillospiraceae bacterium]
MRVKCRICPHGCEIAEGEVGFCKARGNIGGKIACLNYAKATALALDPIEKKPLCHFHPGSKILSVGSFGCNMRCGFCQNHHISMSGEHEISSTFISPSDLADKASMLVSGGNIGVAYTYNEPLIGFEYIYDSAKAVHAVGLMNVVVTNGFINREPLLELLPCVDAFNIDLKGFNDSFYKKMRGDLQTVKNTIETASEVCHVEVSMLIVPGENDSEEEMSFAAKWLSSINRDMPLHISRYFPNYKYSHIPATDVDKIYRLAEISSKYLSHVYTGNIF